MLYITVHAKHNLLLKELPLPLLSVLKKITSGEVDSLEVAKLLLEKQPVSSDCVLIIDEMYIQKSLQYYSGDFMGQDEEGNLHQRIVLFMIASAFLLSSDLFLKQKSLVNG